MFTKGNTKNHSESNMIDKVGTNYNCISKWILASSNGWKPHSYLDHLFGYTELEEEEANTKEKIDKDQRK